LNGCETAEKNSSRTLETVKRQLDAQSHGVKRRLEKRNASDPEFCGA
jgi:hypothetical protein